MILFCIVNDPVQLLWVGDKIGRPLKPMHLNQQVVNPFDFRKLNEMEFVF